MEIMDSLDKSYFSGIIGKKSLIRAALRKNERKGGQTLHISGNFAVERNRNEDHC